MNLAKAKDNYICTPMVPIAIHYVLSSDAIFFLCISKKHLQNTNL